MLGLLGFYLYDSSSRVYFNEGFLIPQARKDWKVTFGSSWFRFGGKDIYLPNPLEFFRPHFRLTWALEGSRPERAWTPLQYPFSSLVPWLVLIALALFVLLPLGFFTRFSEPMLIAALAVLYPSIFIALIVLWRKRAAFALSPARFAALAFESLICPPLALNLIRHVSARLPLSADLLQSARRLQSPARWNKSRAEFLVRIEEEMQSEALDSPRYCLLEKARQALQEDAKHEPS